MKKAILQLFTAILALGLFCGAAIADPSIKGEITPSQNTTIPKTIGDTLNFQIPLNETAIVTWNVNGNNSQVSTDNSNISKFDLSIQLSSYHVTATVNGSELVHWDVTGTNNTGVPVITIDPSSSSISDKTGASRKFTVTVDQASDIKWYIDDSYLYTNYSKTTSSYSNSSATQGKHNVTVEASTGNRSAAKSWTWTVSDQSANNDQSSNSSSGNRIWQDDGIMPKTYTWNAQSFSGFYYDLDTGVSSENMTIYNIGRSIKDGNIVYDTSPTTTKFEHNDWGSYRVIGFMAEKYFAGYIKDNPKDVDAVSPISDGILSKILIDNDDKKSMSSGKSLDLEEGYSLSIKEVDINGKNVMVELEKDGKVVDNDIVSSGGNFVYKTDLGNSKDVPLIIVHFGNVFQGTENSAVFVQGIFQISDNYNEVKSDDTFGEMEVKSISDEKIEMANSNNIGLDKGETVDLMGKIKIKVADSTTLRFAPIVDTSQAGTYELRGTVVDENDSLPVTWTPLNFEGFYYNIDDGIGTENLTINNRNGRTIPDGKLVYESTPTNVSFEHSKWGNFSVVGFMADKYFAGYPEGDDIKDVDHVSLLSNNILSRVLTDNDDKETMYQGSDLALQEGYSLSIKEVDVNGKIVWVQLNKDGKQVDDQFVSSGEDYVYKTDVGKATDIPTIIVHFGTVFSGAETAAVFVQGMFQISNDYTEINEGDSFGKMEVSSVSESGITLENTDSIGLDKGEDTSIMGNISFKTADSDTIRFYPFVKVESGSGSSSASGLNISVPDQIFAGSAFDITVTAAGEPVEDVNVKVNGNSTGNTSADGIVQYTPENSGAIKITAEKKGYSTVSKSTTVAPQKEEISLSVSPESIYVGDNITIAASKKIGNDSIEGAKISIDGQALGSTGPDGKITYTTAKNGTMKVSAIKDGFNDNSISVMVKDREPIFVVSNLTVNPPEVNAGINTTVSANVENKGNADGIYTAELLVNGNKTDSKDISVAIGENKTVTFAISKEIPGNYTAELEGNQAVFKVKENSPILLYVLAAVVLLIIGGAAYYFTKGGGDIGAVQQQVQEKVQELVEKSKKMLKR